MVLTLGAYNQRKSSGYGAGGRIRAYTTQIQYNTKDIFGFTLKISIFSMFNSSKSLAIILAEIDSRYIEYTVALFSIQCYVFCITENKVQLL